jgi:hypothetical protein
VPALAAAGVGAGIASSIGVTAYLTGRQAVRTSVSASPTTRSATAAGNGPTTIGRSSYGTMATCPVTERPPGLSLFDPEAGAMACDGTPQQCAEIVRKNIEAVHEAEWELFWAYTGGQAFRGGRWGWNGFKAWRAARAASAAARGAKAAAATTRFVNPKFAAQLEQQLAKSGGKSIFKSLRSLEGRLAEHEAKLPNLQYKSSVEREIRAFKGQIDTLKQFIEHHGLKP